jgi:vancomycin permeability regulator SanA
VIGLVRVATLPLRIALGMLVLVVLYVGVTFAQVWWDARKDSTAPADTAIVLGAAQFDGRPSPVLQARLDHALALYEGGLTDSVIVTGGKQEGDRFTEAFSSYDYLRNAGVPDEDLFLEVDGTNTYEQLSASRLIMDNHGFTSALLVSDPYHSKRLLAIAGEVGIGSAAVSPTRSPSSVGALLRETGAVAIGRIIGYRRLGNLV